jgi:hypothetical protein
VLKPELQLFNFESSESFNSTDQRTEKITQLCYREKYGNGAESEMEKSSDGLSDGTMTVLRRSVGRLDVGLKWEVEK